VGTNGDGVLRSTDGGKSWEETTTDAKWIGNIVYALAVSKATPGLCYASIPNRVLRSTDGGATWKTFSRGFNWVNFRSLALDEKGGAVWAGSGRDGVVKTVDGGATWTTGTGFLSLEVTTILLDPSSPKRLFVGRPREESTSPRMAARRGRFRTRG
jgi:BNR/Asp-box repeat.